MRSREATFLALILHSALLGTPHMISHARALDMPVLISSIAIILANYWRPCILMLQQSRNARDYIFIATKARVVNFAVFELAVIPAEDVTIVTSVESVHSAPLPGWVEGAVGGHILAVRALLDGHSRRVTLYSLLSCEFGGMAFCGEREYIITQTNVIHYAFIIIIIHIFRSEDLVVVVSAYGPCADLGSAFARTGSLAEGAFTDPHDALVEVAVRIAAG